MFVFFISSIFFVAISNRKESLKILLLIKNSAVTFAADMTLGVRNVKKTVAYNKTLDFMYAYLYLLKNVNRTNDIKLKKLPLDACSLCEIVNYSNIHCLIEKPHIDLEDDIITVSDIDNASIRTDARWTVTKGDLYLEAVYSIIKVAKDEFATDASLPPLVSASLSGIIGSINTNIDVINGISVTKFSTFLKELFIYASYGGLTLLAPIFFQNYTFWWGLVFYTFTYLLSFGAVMVAYKINDPFEDPDVNPFNSFGKTAGRIIDNGAVGIRYHQKHGNLLHRSKR